MEKSIVLWTKNYGTMEKTMVFNQKLWYYTENYGTLIYFLNVKTMVLSEKKLWYFSKL